MECVWRPPIDMNEIEKIHQQQAEPIEHIVRGKYEMAFAAEVAQSKTHTHRNGLR